MIINDEKIMLQIWEPCGGQEPISYQNPVLNGANGIFLVFNLCRRESIENIKLCTKK